MLSESEPKNQEIRHCRKNLPFSFPLRLIASTMAIIIKSAKYIILFLLIFILSSCSVWENFTTYFNLYFNTSTLFEEAETEIITQKRDLFSNDPLVVPGNAKNGLVKVVEKCSKLLQFNPNSAYVDEALIMLGKAFYYQSNYQKSKRKFEEFLAINLDDDERNTEANLWIAKCDFAMKNNSSALNRMEEVRTKAVDEDYEAIIRESYIEEIKFRLREENLNAAISLANQFAEIYDDSKTRAEVYYELGRLYQQIGETENAISAYEKVFDNSPDFDLEISATIKYANALRDAGQFEKALEVFEDIRSQDKFQASFNEIDLEIGITEARLKQYQQALDQFRMVDSTYKSTPFAAAANYEIAELYRYNFMKYDSAQYFYARSVAGNPPKEYVEKARSNSQLFQKYGKLRKDINKFDRQLFYTQNPEIFVKDSAAYLEDSLRILNDFLAKKELEDIWKSVDNSISLPVPDKDLDTAVVKHKIIIADSLRKVDSLIQIGLYDPPDSIGLRQKIQNDLINKFVSDSLSRLDSLVKIGRYNPQDTVGLRVKLKNTLVEKSKGGQNPKDATQTKLAQLLKNPTQVRLDTVKFKKNPPLKLKISVDSAKTVLAKTSLELGNLFLAELNVPDSAYYIYKTILEKYPAPAYYPTTLYALGSYYLTVENKPKADSLFRFIYDNYKDKSIVNAAASKLDLPLIDLSFDPAKDQYASAEDLMLTGDYHQSINRFYNIYKTYPKSPIAPQALYTTGWILENDLFMYDSAAVVYDTLVTKYPTSAYVKNVTKKLTIYKQEKARIQKAVQDSLLALQKQQTDSLIAINQVANETEKIAEDEVLNGKQDLKKTVEITTLPPKTNGLTQKKLEPLWDPRRHFQ